LLLIWPNLEFVRVRGVIIPHSGCGASERCTAHGSTSDKLLALSLFRANLRLLVATALLPPTRPSRLDRALERAQALGANNTFEIRFDKDNVCAFRDVREILATPPQVGVDRAFARSFDAHDNAIRKRGVRAKMGR
jgi:hypothetical protein